MIKIGFWREFKNKCRGETQNEWSEFGRKASYYFVRRMCFLKDSPPKKSSQGFCRKKIVSRLHVGVLIWYADVFLKRRKTKLWNRLFFESRCSWLWGNDVRSEMLETKKRFNPFLFILILKPWHWNPFVSSNKTHQKLRKTSSPQNGVFFFGWFVS